MKPSEESPESARTFSTVRVLVVDDYKPWLEFITSTLQGQPGLQIIGRVSDGLEAVQQAQQLQPDLILLDIGLPTLNGIEAARRIQGLSPTSKILFVSENRSAEIAEETLCIGAGGYLVKSDAASELLPAVKAVLEGKRFLSASVARHDLADAAEHEHPQRENVAPLFLAKVLAKVAKDKVRHEVEFYADDAGFMDGFARFIEGALKVGNAVIVVATELHHAKLLQRLAADGLSVPAEIDRGLYIPLEVTKTLSSFMINNSPDPVLFRKVAGDLITQAARGAGGKHRRVAVVGEGVHMLLAVGNLEATITLEHMWDEIARHYEVDVFCGYFRTEFATEEGSSTLARICAEHSAAYGRELFE